MIYRNIFQNIMYKQKQKCEKYAHVKSIYGLKNKEIINSSSFIKKQTQP